uniref:Uncharacterized protein n=1 Tax=Rhizophora mucronata TaxID=61149 RepID=A0A2P2N040_RHIMU
MCFQTCDSKITPSFSSLYSALLTFASSPWVLAFAIQH